MCNADISERTVTIQLISWCVMLLYRHWHWQKQGHSWKLPDLQGTDSALHSSNGEVFPSCTFSYFCVTVTSQAGQGREMRWLSKNRDLVPLRRCHILGVSLWLLCLQPRVFSGAREELPYEPLLSRDSEFNAIVAVAGKAEWVVMGVVRVCYLFPP